MNDDEIKALVAEEVKRQLSQAPRVVPKVPNFAEFAKVTHHPISSNQPSPAKKD